MPIPLPGITFLGRMRGADLFSFLLLHLLMRQQEGGEFMIALPFSHPPGRQIPTSWKKGIGVQTASLLRDHGLKGSQGTLISHPTLGGDGPDFPRLGVPQKDVSTLGCGFGGHGFPLRLGCSRGQRLTSSRSSFLTPSPK